jgi:hypothetical protein
MRVVRAILGALCGYLIFALTGVALGMVSPAFGQAGRRGGAAVAP